MISERLEKPRALPSPPVAGRRVRLTKREQQIVALIRRGSTNREIAKRLGTTERTVKNQLTTIYAKCRVTSRLQLAVHAHRKRT